MKKLLTSILFFGLMTNVVNAEEVSIPQFSAIFQLETSDEASVAAALTNFAQSDCRKSMPTSIRIMAESFNGDEDITHSVIWSFPDADAVATSFATFASCRAWADTWAVLSQQADYKSNQLFKRSQTNKNRLVIFVWNHEKKVQSEFKGKSKAEKEKLMDSLETELNFYA